VKSALSVLRRLLPGSREPERPGALPGLGLKLRQAHGELLRRYRSRAEKGLWNTLPADGYIHAHLA
jgi:hypothetical protein